MFGDDLCKDEMTNEERDIKQNLFEDHQQQLEANVEKLSKFIEEPFDQYNEDKIMEIRMQVINLSVITDNLCKKMYECIENDLLGSLQLDIHNIAPYGSKGIEKATELPVCWSAKANDIGKFQNPDEQTNKKEALRYFHFQDWAMEGCLLYLDRWVERWMSFGGNQNHYNKFGYEFLAFQFIFGMMSCFAQMGSSLGNSLRLFRG